MSVARRRIISQRASMTSVVSTTRPDIKEFIKNNIIDVRLEDLVIVCVDNKNKSKQIHISFDSGEDGFYKIGKITYFENYLRTVSETFDFTHVGRTYEIVTELIKQILFKLVTIKTSQNFLIYTGTLENNWEIDINSSFLYKIDKTEDGCNDNNSCPICISDYENKEKLTLKCNHSICSSCFWSSIENNMLTCPLCRNPFFSNP